MELVLPNNSLLGRLNDYLSLFWQPAMGYHKNPDQSRKELINNSENQNKKSSIESIYEIERIKLWSITKDNITQYLVGSDLNGNLVRIIGSKQKDLNLLLQEYLENGSSISYKKIKEIMDSLVVDTYLQEYNHKHYNRCRQILESIEIELNSQSQLEPGRSYLKLKEETQ